jgi:hypothetical protein
MVVWSCDLAAAAAGHRCRLTRFVPGGHWGADAVCAGLRWLTDRWPGGTIGNEAEVYSG